MGVEGRGVDTMQRVKECRESVEKHRWGEHDRTGGRSPNFTAQSVHRTAVHIFNVWTFLNHSLHNNSQNPWRARKSHINLIKSRPHSKPRNSNVNWTRVKGNWTSEFANSKHWFTTSFLGGRCRKAVLGVCRFCEARALTWTWCATFTKRERERERESIY